MSMKIRIAIMLALCVAVAYMSGCTYLKADIPNIGAVSAFRFYSEASVSVTTPQGFTLTYGSKPDSNAPLQAFWMGQTMKGMSGLVDSGTALANSPAGQAAIKAYTGGMGLPAGGSQLSGNSGQLPAGVDSTALQEVLAKAGCPLAQTLGASQFAAVLQMLSAGGIPLDAATLSGLMGGKK